MLVEKRPKFIRRLETLVLLIWFSTACFLWAFVALANEIGEGDTRGIDQWLIAMLRMPGSIDPIGPLWLRESMRDVTALGGFTFLTLLTTVFVLSLLFHKKWREGVTLAATAICAQVSIEILKFLYDRPRPGQSLADFHGYSTSFPSGHTAESTAVFLTAATLIANLETRTSTKVLAYAVSIFAIIGVGISRVYLGMHWPSDVLGGWILGALWALLAWGMLRRKRRTS